MLLYSPRNPRNSPLYQIVEDYYEDFEGLYDQKYEKQYGYWRPVIHDVLYKFLDCGDLHQGFAPASSRDFAHVRNMGFARNTLRQMRQRASSGIFLQDKMLLPLMQPEAFP